MIYSNYLPEAESVYPPAGAVQQVRERRGMSVALLKPVALTLFTVAVVAAVLSWGGSRGYPTAEPWVSEMPQPIPASSRVLFYAPSVMGTGSPLGQWHN